MKLTIDMPESVLRGIAKNAVTYDRKGCPNAARLARAVGAELPVRTVHEFVPFAEIGPKLIGRVAVGVRGVDGDVFPASEPFTVTAVNFTCANFAEIKGGDCGFILGTVYDDESLVVIK